MDVSQYLEIFLDETNEHLQNLNTQILSLEQDPENMDTINEIFRAAHSLKGMAGTMGYKRMQTLTHDMENVFSEVRNGNIKVKADMIDVLFQCLDALEEYNTNIRESSDEGTNDNGALIKRLNDIMGGDSDDSAAPSGQAPQEQAQAAETAAVGGGFVGIKLNENQQSVLSEAIRQGKRVYGLTVKVQESCILKAARAFLVFKAIEDTSEIIVSDPSSQDIEDEKFEQHFSLIIVSEAELNEVVKAAKSVSEIEDVSGSVLNLDDVGGAGQTEESHAAETVEEPAAAAAPAETPQPPAETPAAAPAEAAQTPAPAAAPAAKKAPVNRPVVNRTVRVDIEKLDTLMNLVSELIIAKNSLVSASAMSGNSSQAVNEQIEYLESVTTSLHESVMKVRMVPIESTVNKFPRMVRDLQKK
ncbi:MAG: Hpt domain-containing protein, partial [Lachnospiraceae bacterium]|nr:Hpt domain-containing protein [Lachnospiraceae bacterium]